MHRSTRTAHAYGARTRAALAAACLAALAFGPCACEEATEQIDPRELFAGPGKLPGSECRPEGDPAGRCDVALGGRAGVDLECVGGLCTLDCDDDPLLCARELGFAFGCASSVGGFCAERCTSGCDAGFECFARDGVCLPIGAVPGGSCRPEGDPDGRCDGDVNGVEGAEMRCEQGRCVIDCAAGGDALCAEVSAELVCAGGDEAICAERCGPGGTCRDADMSCFERDDACLPTGAFPGSPCRAADDPKGPCDDAAGGVDGADMSCQAGVCVIDCAAGGDALCAEVDVDLACAESAGHLCAERCLEDGGCRDAEQECFTRDGVCLPIGSYPGGPCRDARDPAGRCDADVAGVAGADMRCEQDRCVIPCDIGGHALCEEVDPDLACSDAAGMLCVEKCDAEGGCRDPDMSCFDDDLVCLPTGAFPGSPCREGASPCDHDLDGDPDADMRCVEGTCTIDCATGGDALCERVDESLTCVDAMGVCTRRCELGTVCRDRDMRCYEDESACLPIGSFPGSECRAEGDPAGSCDTDLFGVDALDMTCMRGVCLVSCRDGGDGLCRVVDPSLGCSVAADDTCLLRCDADAAGCPEGSECLESENVCLPIGSYPGGSCRATDDPEGPCDQDLKGIALADMRCRDGVCVLGCEEGGDALCADVIPDLACAERADHLCAERCRDDGSCRDPEFACFETDGVCLPRGVFPGSPCRSTDDPAGACDAELSGVEGARMRCERGLCVVACEEGGDARCAEVDASLACAESLGVCARECLADGSCEDAGESCFGREGVCLPIGAVPGGPCRGTNDPAGACDPDVGGVDGADMRCEDGRCVIPCEIGGDALCAEVDATLACSERAGLCAERCESDGGCREAGFACFEDEGVCLPRGAFPGSPCRAGASPCDHDLGGDPDADMVCAQGTCVIDCKVGGDGLCAGIDASLTCVDSLGVCVRACDEGACGDAGEACFEEEGACLPIGGFPGSACRAQGDPAGRCDLDLFGFDLVDMVCERDTCVVSCAGDREGVCALVDPSLGCAVAAGGFCVKRCEDGCDDGFGCFEREDVCLPEGAFPGGPCRAASDPAGACDARVAGVEGADMACREGTCVIGCEAGGDALCAAVDGSLLCAESVGHVCAERCVDGGCRDPGSSCFERDGVCLPRGSFPGGACRDASDPEGACDAAIDGIAGADMRCEDGRCVIGCEAGGDALCAKVSADLVCVESVSVCAERCLGGGGCRDDAMSCFATEGACLPTGAFPGSPCREQDDPAGVCDADVAGVAGADMRCEAGLCVIPCASADDATCAAVDPRLGCGAKAGVCAERCRADGSCRDATFECFEDDGVCLPLGSFPGSACRAGPAPCDHDIGGDPSADMVCVEGVCAIDCAPGGDPLCVGVDLALTCVDPLGVCARRCSPEGTCASADEACFSEERACLPVGAFPGSPCRARTHPEGRCDVDLFGFDAIDMVCERETCVVSCADEPGLCGLVDPSLGCASAAGGLCVRRCDVGAPGCDDGFECFARDDVCLPEGSFPGSTCRPAGDPKGRCDADLAGNTAADMTCRDGLCVLSCARGGDTLCASIDAALTCAENADRLCAERCLPDGSCRDASFECFDVDGVCLPRGSFPGSPCREASDPEGACDVDLGGNVAADMRCERGLCAIDCASGGDATCTQVSALLACAETVGLCAEACLPDGGCRDAALTCFSRDGVCVPVGSVPGGPCRAQDDPAGPCDAAVAGIPGADMRCEAGLCVVGCATGGDALCAAVDETLACAEKSGALCAEKCLSGGGCATAGFSCFGEDGVCLPTGSFPGSPCRDGASPCDHDLAGNPAADMKCVEDTCVVACDDRGDAQCVAVDPSLTCFDRLGVCVRACLGALCADPGEACFADEGGCLPTGSFPGSPCRAGGDRCDQDLFGVDVIDMSCVNDLCVIGCPPGREGVCGLADPRLACAVQAGGLCLPSCASGCGSGFECFEEDGACLPTGSFPGSHCRASGLRCDVLPMGPMACAVLPGGDERCLLDCEGDGDAPCQALRADLVCATGPVPPSCLPRGSFVGSPCREASDPAGRCDGTPLPLACVQDAMCTIGCLGQPESLCDALTPGWVCAEEGGGFCAPGCDAGPCPAGRACFAPDDACLIACDGWDDPTSCAGDADFACDGARGVCRPRGTFVGASCRAEGDPDGRCDADLVCVAGACLPDCTQGGDALCALWSTEHGLPLEVCAETPSAAICTARCEDDADCTDIGGACDLATGSCLPYRTVSVLHTGGLGGHVLGVSPHLAYTPELADDDPTLGGFSRLAALAQEARHQAALSARTVFAVDSGDFLVGTALALLGGEPERTFFDVLGWDAVALGEHELDHGAEALAAFLDANTQGARVVPWLAANLVAEGAIPAALEALWSPDASAPIASHPLRPWVIIERDGRRLGLFALIGERALGGRVTTPLALSDQVTIARSTIAHLRAEGAEMIALLAHESAAAPPRLDALDELLALVPGIDLVIAGHGDGGLVGARVSHGALVVQVPPRGVMLGEARVAIGRDGVAPESSTWHAWVADDDLLGDAGWIAREQAWRDEADDVLASRGLALDQVLTTTDFDLDLDSGAGDVVVDAMLTRSEAALATPPATATHSAIAFERELGDPIRALRDGSGSALETAIAVADAWALFPFGVGGDGVPGDPLVDVWLTTEDLRAVMEVGATLAELVDPGLALEVAGLVVDVRDNNPPFARVVGLYRTDASGRDAVGDDLLETSLPGDRHRVTMSLSLARLLVALPALSDGALTPTLRDAADQPFLDVGDARLDLDPGTPAIDELDGVMAIIDALSAMELESGGVPAMYSVPSERFRVCRLADPSACPAP